MKDGYEEAASIDNTIMNLLRDHPVTKENALAWMNFTRTISTTLTIITTLAELKDE